MHFHNEDLTNDPNRGKVRIALDQELDVIEEMAPISRPEELAKDIATLVRRDGWESFRSVLLNLAGIRSCNRTHKAMLWIEGGNVGS